MATATATKMPMKRKKKFIKDPRLRRRMTTINLQTLRGFYKVLGGMFPHCNGYENSRGVHHDSCS